MQLVTTEDHGRFKAVVLFDEERKYFLVQFWFDGQELNIDSYITPMLHIARVCAFRYCYDELDEDDLPGMPNRKKMIKARPRPYSR